MPITRFSFRDRFRLLCQLVLRDITGRYRGAMLGVAWTVMSPLLMLGVYTFVFSVVFNARWSKTGETDRLEFALMVYCGLVIFGLFSECVGRAPRAIVDQVNYVKKVVFPLDLLPLSLLFSTLFQAAIGLVLLSGLAILRYGFSNTLWVAPAVLLPFLLLLAGLVWFLSALGVYLRDLNQAITPMIGALQFMSPVFYPLDAVPAVFRDFLILSPLTWPISALRECLLQHSFPSLLSWFLNMGIGLLVAIAGWLFFEKTRKGFADVL